MAWAAKNQDGSETIYEANMILMNVNLLLHHLF